MTSARILVVDDDLQIQRAMRAILSAEKYIVIDAASGEEALARIRDQRPDLVLLDLNMPGMGGMEACRAIRGGCQAPIIILSVRDSEQDKIEVLDAGADDYVTKPFNIHELLARIRAALRRTSPAGSQMIRAGNLELHASVRRVLMDGRDLRLTPKQFDLLHYLVTHPDVSIPHARLLQAVWGPDYGDELEYLRVFINQLRKKIETDPSRPSIILTERWIGYRFKAQS